jgi:hypothetical protein
MADPIRDGVRRRLRLPLRTSADTDAELAAFLAERVDHLVARGMAPFEAREEAMRRLGPSLNDTTQLLHDSARAWERHISMRRERFGPEFDGRTGMGGLKI